MSFTFEQCLVCEHLCNWLQVWWEDLDPEDRPVLMVRLGRAVNECTTKAEADTIAEVIISQASPA